MRISRIDLVALIGCGLAISANAATDESVFADLIAQVKSNENVASSVVIEGYYTRVLYDERGGEQNREELDSFRFTRVGDAVKLETRGWLSIASPDGAKPLMSPIDSVFYYSRGSAVRAGPGASRGQIWQRLCPSPFPLFTGTGIQCVSRNGKYLLLSSLLEEHAQQGRLHYHTETTDPGILVVELNGKPENGVAGKVVFWLDTKRDYLVLKRKAYMIGVPKPGVETLLEAFEASAKRFGDYWFIEKGRIVRCPEQQDICGRKEVEDLVITKFSVVPALKQQELQAPATDPVVSPDNGAKSPRSRP
ncbi:MAG: hypothetical protein PCFJNLEI_03520 [Verrucomicrobiae bacterium]|nr:hypothetical protein [Verrucomicrobiae bacterium]